MPAASSAANRAFSAAMTRACSATRAGFRPAGDRQRLGVVGQDLVGVAAAAGRLDHDLDRLVPVRPVGVAVQVAAEIAELEQAREGAGERRLDLAGVLAQLRLDEREAEEVVGLRLGGEGAQLGGVPGQRLAVLAEAQEALLGQAPALVAGHRPQPDVVLLGSGEVDPIGAGRASAGMAIRSTCGPRISRTADFWVPRLITRSTMPSEVKAAISAPGSLVSASRSRSPIDSRRRRNDPAGSID